MAADSLAISLFSRANSTNSVIDFAHEMQCYSLPYGGIGFASHVLAYYTIICLWNGRKPMWPFQRVKYSWFDLALGVVGLCVSAAMAIVTIVRCRNTWQLTVIAIWKLSMSLLNGFTAIHVAVLVLNKPLTGRQEGAELGAPIDDIGPGVVLEQAIQRVPLKEKTFRSAAWWILLYLPGMFAGMCGLTDIVHHVEGAMENVRTITTIFYVAVGFGLFVCFLGLWYGGPRKGSPAIILGLVWTYVAFSILSVFYSDWVLGMVSTNLIGLPSADSSGLYWTYFISKRLPMFSW